MSFTDENIICPYPGLRPFREDESIFLRGRDEHVEQITRQLEQKKFLMLTGASGDGKSSLVYAGLIPNARAGFFKAKFNNWQVVDFRPERAPLQNLEDALAARFSGDVRERFRRELKFGFSSLIDIYTESPHYIDKSAPEFLALPETEQRKAIRRGSNLLILVDQFEEFFTNPENYYEGKSSSDAQLVVSMLLETCRIATERDLPVYVVCTMRSDYIGQCASFRGLPEAIGHSQFFVPRLKRKEIYQVIEEPAQLNGNKISKRLVEMLLHQMGEGIDQLPVLQHALNQIWNEAGKGAEEMDLIHFARVGGVDATYLPEADKESFSEWKAALPEHRRPFFENPNLDNVLDRHANDLYHEAHAYFLERHPGHALTHDQAREIIETAFRSLTKIDASRSVRNRMTLHEIVHLLHQPQLGLAEVSGVLEIFRLPGNTFLQPFYEAGEASPQDQAAWVMDITHESLIRNWGKLIEWSHAEEQDHQTWLDFAKQLNRWVDNGKTSGYLLPIGPLNFFEGWFEKKQPNEYWLMKYDERDVSADDKLRDAQVTLMNARRFIRASIGKLFFSRFVLKHGAQRVALWACMAVLLFFCEYFRRDYSSKTNESVVRDAENRGIELLTSARVNPSEKARFLINYESLHPGSMESMLRRCGGDSVQLLVMEEAVQKYLPNNVHIIQNFNAIKPRIATQLNQLMGGYAKRLLGRYHESSDTLRYQHLLRLAGVSSLIFYADVKLGYAPDSLNAISTEIQKLMWRDLVMETIHKQDTTRSYEVLSGCIDFAMANGIARDSVAAVIHKLVPLLGDTASRFLQEVSALRRAEWLAGLYAYCGQVDECTRIIETADFRSLKISALYNTVAKAWMGHHGDDFPEIILKVQASWEKDRSPWADLWQVTSIQDLSLGLLTINAGDGTIPYGFLVSADPGVRMEYHGLFFNALKRHRVETICKAYDAYSHQARYSFTADPRENVFQKAMAQKLRLEFASANQDSVVFEDAYQRYYEYLLSLDEAFLKSGIEIIYNKNNNAGYSRAIWLACPNYYGGLLSTYNQMDFIVHVNQHYPNEYGLRILQSEWARNYPWSQDDMAHMKRWLLNFELPTSAFELPEKRFVNTKYFWELYDFINQRLDDSNKDHEFKLLGNLMACLHPDSLWNTKGVPFLDKETELELFHPTGPLALRTIINKELHIRESGTEITNG
ncbi:MAG: ATP-binding protein, partial [Flavobacteriales bacterium]